MPLSPRSRFALAVISVVTLLAWPRAISPNDTNGVALVLVLVAVVLFISVATRIGHSRTGAPMVDTLAFGVEVPMIVTVLVAAVLCSERPTYSNGDRPANASFGVLAKAYDPCERGDEAVVCSGVALSVGYVCRLGYTVRVGRCPRGACAPVPISAGARDDVACEVSP